MKKEKKKTCKQQKQTTHKGTATATDGRHIHELARAMLTRHRSVALGDIALAASKQENQSQSTREAKSRTRRPLGVSSATNLPADPAPTQRKGNVLVPRNSQVIQAAKVLGVKSAARGKPPAMAKSQAEAYDFPDDSDEELPKRRPAQRKFIAAAPVDTETLPRHQPAETVKDFDLSVFDFPDSESDGALEAAHVKGVTKSASAKGKFALKPNPAKPTNQTHKEKPVDDYEFPLSDNEIPRKPPALKRGKAIMGKKDAMIQPQMNSALDDYDFPVSDSEDIAKPNIKRVQRKKNSAAPKPVSSNIAKQSQIVKPKAKIVKIPVFPDEQPFDDFSHDNKENVDPSTPSAVSYQPPKNFTVPTRIPFADISLSSALHSIANVRANLTPQKSNPVQKTEKGDLSSAPRPFSVPRQASTSAVPGSHVSRISRDAVQSPSLSPLVGPAVQDKKSLIAALPVALSTPAVHGSNRTSFSAHQNVARRLEGKPDAKGHVSLTSGISFGDDLPVENDTTAHSDALTNRLDLFLEMSLSPTSSSDVRTDKKIAPIKMAKQPFQDIDENSDEPAGGFAFEEDPHPRSPEVPAPPPPQRLVLAPQPPRKPAQLSPEQDPDDPFGFLAAERAAQLQRKRDHTARTGPQIAPPPGLFVPSTPVRRAPSPGPELPTAEGGESSPIVIESESPRESYKEEMARLRLAAEKSRLRSEAARRRKARMETKENGDDGGRRKRAKKWKQEREVVEMGTNADSHVADRENALDALDTYKLEEVYLKPQRR